MITANKLTLPDCGDLVVEAKVYCPILLTSRLSLQHSIKASLQSLCPVHPLQYYIDPTLAIWFPDQLLICHWEKTQVALLYKQRLAHWVLDITMAYRRAGHPALIITHHSMRSVSCIVYCSCSKSALLLLGHHGTLPPGSTRWTLPFLVQRSNTASCITSWLCWKVSAICYVHKKISSWFSPSLVDIWDCWNHVYIHD